MLNYIRLVLDFQLQQITAGDIYVYRYSCTCQCDVRLSIPVSINMTLLYV